MLKKISVISSKICFQKINRIIKEKNIFYNNCWTKFSETTKTIWILQNCQKVASVWKKSFISKGNLKRPLSSCSACVSGHKFLVFCLLLLFHMQFETQPKLSYCMWIIVGINREKDQRKGTHSWRRAPDILPFHWEPSRLKASLVFHRRLPLKIWCKTKMKTDAYLITNWK